MPAGYGLDNSVSPNLVVTCDSTNCLDCKANHLICVVCDTVAGYYLRPLDSKCFSFATMPTSFGLELISSHLIGCLDSLCLDCRTNHEICVGCDTANQYLLQGNTCIHVNNIPDLFGADWISYMVTSCIDLNCQKCKLDISFCTQCKSNVAAKYLNPTTKTCLTIDQIPAGHGIDNAVRYRYSC